MVYRSVLQWPPTLDSASQGWLTIVCQIWVGGSTDTWRPDLVSKTRTGTNAGPLQETSRLCFKNIYISATFVIFHASSHQYFWARWYPVVQHHCQNWPTLSLLPGLWTSFPTMKMIFVLLCHSWFLLLLGLDIALFIIWLICLLWYN